MQSKPDVTLAPVKVTDSPELYQLVVDSMASLSTWLPWAKRMKNVATERRFLAYAVNKQDQSELYMYTIRVNGEVAGAIDLHNLDWDNHHAEIGYWLGDRFRGQGTMARSVKQLEQIARELSFHLLLILVDIENQASQRVAIRSCYQQDSVINDYLFDGENWHDCVFYSKIMN